MRLLALLGLLCAVGAAADEISFVEVGRLLEAGVQVSDGTIQAIRQSDVAAQVPGRVTALLVRAGDRVKAGQVMARIDDRELGAAETASQAAILEAGANLKKAELDLTRNRALAERRFVSAAVVDASEAQVKALRARVEALTAAAGAAGAARGHTAVTAPYAGVVAMTRVDVGDMAMPGRVILSLFEPGAMRAVAYLADAQLATIRRGLALAQPVVEVDGRRIGGVNTTILPTADPGTRTTEVRIDLPADAAVMPGQFVRVQFATDAAPRLAIPRTAVLRRGELTAVYVAAADSRVQQRQVRLGEALADGRVEVLAGLKAGERVALEPVKAGIMAAAR